MCASGERLAVPRRRLCETISPPSSASSARSPLPASRSPPRRRAPSRRHRPVESASPPPRPQKPAKPDCAVPSVSANDEVESTSLTAEQCACQSQSVLVAASSPFTNHPDSRPPRSLSAHRSSGTPRLPGFRLRSPRSPEMLLPPAIVPDRPASHGVAKAAPAPHGDDLLGRPCAANRAIRRLRYRDTVLLMVHRRRGVGDGRTVRAGQRERHRLATLRHRSSLQHRHNRPSSRSRPAQSAPPRAPPRSPHPHWAVPFAVR